MSAEAHKLIGISLSKIAQSRASRGGVSLHKNLLVATVLHKARYIFMEEAYQFVHGGGNKINSNIQESPFYKWNLNNVDNQNDDENNSELNKLSDDITTTVSDDSVEKTSDDYELPVIDNHSIDSTTDNSEKLLNDITSEQWRDNTQIATSVESTSSTGEYKNPPSYQAHIELTYLNLDKNDATEKPETNNNNLKRRHSEWEVEEAVLSILPKRSKSYIEESSPPSSSSSSTSETDFTFLDESDFLSEPSTSRLSPTDDKLIVSPPSMEIDRLSSLVSIFSFANFPEMSGMCEDDSKLSLDQCSTQAKDNSDVLQPMPSFLAMTV
ncbi:GATA zinc finger domain-containing protein 24-like isoform X1 [Chrysoperla carnea]|uniref:GATA zinc finger domain-containing protein 24-like isoform X1 n=1 Tax=Chrysoperla carnea TaxID=189513 RepID=UPI001D0974CB|nr:GATA zinc finger domain-containing protein 24-like isoform X1 [Chrysoperla carnea]